MPRIEEIGRAVGKRKATQPQATMAPREEFKTFLSYHSKSSDGKKSKGNRLRTKTKQKAKVIVGSQLNGVGPSKPSELFVFGVENGLSNVNGPNQGPFPFSSSSRLDASPKETKKEAQTNSLRISSYGENI